MLKKLGKLNIITAVNKQNAIMVKKTGKIIINKQIIPTYITNPFSGKQTNIPIKMLDQLNKNYFPNLYT